MELDSESSNENTHSGAANKYFTCRVPNLHSVGHLGHDPLYIEAEL